MIAQVLIQLVLLPLSHGAAKTSPEKEKDIPMMTVPQLIKYWGYPVEEHWVTTTDGYILGLHRILVLLCTCSMA